MHGFLWWYVPKKKPTTTNSHSPISERIDSFRNPLCVNTCAILSQVIKINGFFVCVCVCCTRTRRILFALPICKSNSIETIVEENHSGHFDKLLDKIPLLLTKINSSDLEIATTAAVIHRIVPTNSNPMQPI